MSNNDEKIKMISKYFIKSSAFHAILFIKVEICDLLQSDPVCHSITSDISKTYKFFGSLCTKLHPQ